MKIKKEDFERFISLAYQRGRVTKISFISKEEIAACISDIYEVLGLKKSPAVGGYRDVLDYFRRNHE